jgi:glutamate-1-semialdehyde 2,1-aminomutase
MPTLDRYRQSRALLARARAVIPGGHHLSGRPLLDPETSPMYFASGHGCRIRDVDGNELVDYLMAYGACGLGYAHPEVEAAAAAQLRSGALLSLNHPLQVTLAEALVRFFPSAEMAVLLKTGSEATTAALRIARRYTGRRKVVRCGYHGWHDWCAMDEPAVRGSSASEVLSFDARDPASLERVLAEHRSEVAAVILAPEMILSPRTEDIAVLLEMTRAAGAVFVLDEVKTAFRIDPGSIQARLGLRPDLTTVSKAMSNGWPVAAVVGRRDVMLAAEGLHLSATYHGDTAAIAAALKTMEILAREPILPRLWSLGERLLAGLAEAAARHGIAVSAYGEPYPPMPFLAFTDPDVPTRDTQRRAFYTHVLARGQLLHPRHLWFISAAHGEKELEETLAVAAEGFAVAAKS